ncbi:hypothetical protein Dsin_028490 [Dipteronia sinensis]|uniref:Uncharacterized protein n=1 Tax=Dipteronia sinensis TaxID=43782 RepID=A0AAD9ZQY9_9ROSI|nr:hypothetical protein Dsin_028490 [Dipteronia sinensis]
MASTRKDVDRIKGPWSPEEDEALQSPSSCTTGGKHNPLGETQQALLNLFIKFKCYEENTSIMTSKNLLIWQEDSIREAAKKLELVKQKRMKRKIKTMSNGDVGALNTWAVAKSWSSCPIAPEPSERKEMWEQKQCSDKREASCIIDLLDNTSVNKMKETQVGYESDDEDVFQAGGAAKGHLMIGRVWKKVGEQELQVIESGVRILV